MTPRKKAPVSALPPKKTFVPPVEQVEPAPNYRPWYFALLGVGVVVLGASTYFALSGTMPRFEAQLFSWINGAYLPNWVGEQVAKPLSNAVWGIAGLVVLMLAIPKFRYRAWQYVAAGGGAYVLTYIVEHLVVRGRPADLPFDVMLRAVQGGPGFPSGHVATLTAIGLAIWPFVAWPWRVLVLVFIGAEAWARIYLGVHAPLDVIGGIGVGMIVVATMRLLPAKMKQIFKIA